jgi:hypothetical protein
MRIVRISGDVISPQRGAYVEQQRRLQFEPKTDIFPEKRSTRGAGASPKPYRAQAGLASVLTASVVLSHFRQNELLSWSQHQEIVRVCIGGSFYRFMPLVCRRLGDSKPYGRVNSTEKWDESGHSGKERDYADEETDARPHRGNTSESSKVEMTIGIDLGDVWSHYCTLNLEGEVVDRGRFRMTPSGGREVVYRFAAGTDGDGSGNPLDLDQPATPGDGT